MGHRIFSSVAAVSVVAWLASPAFAQQPSAHNAHKAAAHAGSSIPRTPDGHPDFEGVWTNETLTPLQRPAQFAGKPTVTEAEAKVFENAQATDLKQEDGASDGPIIRAAGSSGTGGYNALFIDRGSQLETIDGVKRTSLIVDPPDGKMPPMTDEGKKRMGERMRGYMRSGSDNVKDHPASERCLIGFGSTSGPPMMPVLYNNTYQIVQTKDTVMILVEMIHDVRIVRMNGTHPPPSIRAWLGDSIGHWDGDTLVVDTTNFNEENSYMGMASPDMHVIERFERTDANTILYKATIEDPHTWTRPWTVEFPFRATKGPVYEYACHEGNYAMDDILGGAEKKAESQPKK
ncbi:MAG TPA: hypothetical protein VMG40_04240 [Bryobacteraceae bacterium]|nr:hypothetical protein [Bryobacteraceae bacterium]